MRRCRRTGRADAGGRRRIGRVRRHQSEQLAGVERPENDDRKIGQRTTGEQSVSFILFVPLTNIFLLTTCMPTKSAPRFSDLWGEKHRCRGQVYLIRVIFFIHFFFTFRLKCF